MKLSTHRPAVGPAGLVVTAALLAVAALAPAARADGLVLTVTDVGQPSAPVEVGQPPLSLLPTGTCPHPFTLAGESGCPPGTWPPLGKRSTDPGGWAPSEHVAGGDTLELAFSSAVAGVSIGSTSNYEPGLHDPDGGAIPNFDVIAESAAASTADPAVWQVTLPPFDARAINGYTFSVVAEDGAGFHGYPFEIRTPRFADELAMCGTAYFSTGVQQGLCPSKAIPPGLSKTKRHRNRHRCRKGFRKRRVHGKRRCVRVKKKHRKRHQRHGHRHTR